MQFHNGSLFIGRWHGAPILVHWSTPIGAFVLTGCGFSPAAWLGFFVIILVHELGHAVMVRASHARVTAIQVHGMGGHCLWSGMVSPLQGSAIAFAGVWAQAALFAVAYGLSALYRGAMSPFEFQLLRTLMVTNAVNACFNLLPIPPLDGARAWRLFPQLAQRLWRHLRRDRFTWRAPRSPRVRVWTRDD